MMIWTLFIIGVLTAVASGCKALGQENTHAQWPWVLSGFGGACLAVLAIYLRHWGF